jgi:hypothetical protein
LSDAIVLLGLEDIQQGIEEARSLFSLVEISLSVPSNGSKPSTIRSGDVRLISASQCLESEHRA